MCVLREDKHLGLIKKFQKIADFKLVSEIHEAGLPETSRSGKRGNFQGFLNSLDGILLTSNAQKAHIKTKGFSLPNCIILHNGVELRIFAQAKRKSNGHKIITYTGMFNPWKNIPLLFQSLQRLPEEYSLRIAGGKMNCLDSSRYIQNLCTEYGVADRVDFRGYVLRENLAQEVLSGSSVLAVPLDNSISAMYATSPMKLIEYLATQIPIVAVNAPSIRSIVTEKEALLCDANPEAFAKAITNACNEDQTQRVRHANELAKLYDHGNRAEQLSSWLEILLRRSQKPEKGYRKKE